MAEISLQNLRPRNATAAAIREALAAIVAERAVVHKRMADEIAARPDLLLTSTVAAIRTSERAVEDDQTNLCRLDALEAELHRKLSEAIATEAAAAHGEKVRAAIVAIEKFNSWLATEYAAHAQAIAVGVELERIALRGIDGLRDPITKASTAELPPLARAYVRQEARGLAFLCRLPAAEPGPPIVWPN